MLRVCTEGGGGGGRKREEKKELPLAENSHCEPCGAGPGSSTVVVNPISLATCSMVLAQVIYASPYFKYDYHRLRRWVKGPKRSVCLCVSVYVCVSVCLCVCMSVRACIRVYMCMCALTVISTGQM